MRRWLLVLLPLLWPASASAQLANCNLSTVQAAIDAASNGATVTLPAGTCTWTGPARIENKRVNLVGAGSGTGGTVINHDISVNPHSLLIINPGSAATTSSQTMEVTGIHWKHPYGCIALPGGNSGSCQVYMGLIQADGAAGWAGLRIHHNTFTSEDDRDHHLDVKSYIGPLIDHNTFNGTMLAMGVKGAGDGDWTSSLPFGAPETFVVFEDNVINGRSDDANWGANDVHTGGRIVFRRNTVNRAFFQTHDYYRSGQPSGHAFEVYQNVFTNNVNPAAENTGIRALDLTSGTGMVWENAITSYWQYGIYMRDAASAGLGYFGYLGTSDCDGTVLNWDQNTTGQTGWRCRYQLGSHLLGSSAISVPIYVANNTCSTAFTWGTCAGGYTYADVDSGAYGCGAAFDSRCTSGSLFAIPTTTHVVANRDYYQTASGPQTTSSSPFNGTSGTGWGTIANRPTSATDGVAYLATNEGEWDACDGEDPTTGAHTPWYHDNGCAAPNGPDGKWYRRESGQWVARYGGYTGLGANTTGLPMVYPDPRQGGGTPPNQNPSVTISSPSANFNTQSSTLDFSGTASDDGTVSSVAWANSLTGGSGAATFSAPNWTKTALPLNAGINPVTVTATDNSKATGNATVSVNRESCGSSFPYTQAHSLNSTGTAWPTIPCFRHVGPGQPYEIVSNRGTTTSSSFDMELYSNGSVTLNSDHFVKVTLVTVDATSQLMRLCIRGSGTTGQSSDQYGYFFQIGNSSPYNLVGRYNGPNGFDAYDLVGGIGAVVSGTTTAKFGALGNVLTAYVNDVAVWSKDISTVFSGTPFTGGSAGPCPVGVGTTWDSTIVDNTPPAPGDLTPPVPAISTPTVSPDYVTSSSTMTLAGTATDAVGVTACTYSNSRTTGSTSMTLGAGTTSRTFTASSVPLSIGLNVLTVDCQDAAGNHGQDVLNVTYGTPPNPPRRPKSLRGIL